MKIGIPISILSQQSVLVIWILVIGAYLGFGA